MSVQRVQPFNVIQSAYLRQACIVLNAEIAYGITHISAQVAFQGSAVK